MSSPSVPPPTANRSAPPPPAAFWRWRRWFEIGFWVVLTLINGVANSITVIMDIHRVGLDFADWEPAVWEWSSGMTILALIPVLVWFTRRYPLHWDTWRQTLPVHVAGSLMFSLIHVVVMVALRHAAYAAQGGHYDFGHWQTELTYEYLKDVRSYTMMVCVIEGYRYVLRRLQGEVSLLDRPDEGDPVEPLDRPERFLVRKLNREFLIAAADIEWMQAAGNYVNLRVRGHDYPLRSTIAGIEARLDPERFARIHRSYIVNFAQITSIEPLETGDARVHLKDGSSLPCSRRYRDELRSRAAAT